MITAYLTVIAFLMCLFLPLYIPLAVTLAPLAMAGMRRSARSIAKGRQVLGTFISQRGLELRPGI
jgi:hypothetical protein